MEISHTTNTSKVAIILLVTLILTLSALELVQSAEVRVDSVPALRKAIAAVAAGDRIVVANGSYAVREPITIAAIGSNDQPIVITAEKVGGVEIKGEAGFRFATPAAYTVVRGFVFTHKAGEMEIPAGVHHCRVTRNVFELSVTDRARYLSVAGDDNEIDHNTFRNKSTEGQMLQVQGPGGSEMAQRVWVHHNYFHDFKNSRRNNSSALHIGHSARSMTPAYAVVERNLFVRTHGENEGAICNKASDNLYRFNTLGEDSSELSLRHGKRCLVYGNFFLGGNGLRFFSHDHRIYSNYFTNCRPAIAIGNGGATIPPGPLTSHERPERVHIVFNTLVHNRANVQMSRRRSGLGATDLVFANNIVVGGNEAVSIDGPLENPSWEGNIVWDCASGDLPASGFTSVDPKISKRDDGWHQLDRASPAIGQAVGAYGYVDFDVQGQPRGSKKHIGADQVSSQSAANRPLTSADVGPNAPEEERAWFSAPQVHDREWFTRGGTAGSN